MSRRTDTMGKAAELAGEHAGSAGRRLAEQQQLLASGEAQLRELETFRDEYAGTLRGGVDVRALLNHRQFLQRINEAIEHQRGVVQRQREALEQERIRWLAAHSRAKALESVAQRFQDADRRADERREQAQADERTQRPPAAPWPDEGG